MRIFFGLGQPEGHSFLKERVNKMENNFEKYEALLSGASEAAEACLDMEGGAFLLAWTGELIRDLATEGYCRSARLTAQKLCKAVGVDLAWEGHDGLDSAGRQAWLSMFAEALMDHVMAVAK